LKNFLIKKMKMSTKDDMSRQDWMDKKEYDLSCTSMNKDFHESTAIFEVGPIRRHIGPTRASSAELPVTRPAD
jgi:hypothetical protein